MKLPVNKSLRNLARNLRKKSTLSEVLLWNQLKQKRAHGLAIPFAGEGVDAQADGVVVNEITCKQIFTKSCTEFTKKFHPIRSVIMEPT